jgi:hypothetical protein
MKKVLIASVIALAIFLINTTGIHAIICLPQPPTEEAFERSSIVFSGKVVEVTKLPISNYGHFEVKFEVYDIWKGADTKFITVIDNTWGTGSYPKQERSIFTIGSEYLIYLRGPSISVCPWKKSLSEAQEEIKELEKISRTKYPPIYNLYYQFLLTNYKIRFRLFNHYYISLKQVLILVGAIVILVVFGRFIRHKLIKRKQYPPIN